MIMSTFDTDDSRWLDDGKIAIAKKLETIRAAKDELQEGFEEYFKVFIKQHGLDETVIRSTSMNPGTIEGKIEIKNGKVNFKANKTYNTNIGNFYDFFNATMGDSEKYIARCETALTTNYMTPEEYEKRKNTTERS